MIICNQTETKIQEHFYKHNLTSPLLKKVINHWQNRRDFWLWRAKTNTSIHKLTRETIINMHKFYIRQSKKKMKKRTSKFVLCVCVWVCECMCIYIYIYIYIYIIMSCHQILIFLKGDSILFLTWWINKKDTIKTIRKMYND